MLTEFGKFLRIIRMNSHENAENMAKKLYISTSYLYLIENGKRRIPKDMEINISNAYSLSDEDKKMLHRIVSAERTPHDEQIETYINNIENTFDGTQVAQKNAPTVEKRKNKIWFFLIGVVVLALAVILIIIALVNNKSSKDIPPSHVSDTTTEYAKPEIPTEPTPAEMFEYEERDGRVCITGYIGNESSVLVPKEINGKPVYEIVEGAFANNQTVKSVFFSEGISRLGFHIFENCSELEYIELPSSVYYIGNGLALSCGKLECAVIGDGATFMGEYSFDGCTSLKSIKIGKNISQIDHNAFDSCRSLKEIELPASLTAIKYHAFYGCTGLESVEIPNGVVLIEDNAFCRCSSLVSIFVPPSVKKIGNNIFGECHKLTVYGYTGSYIEEYCTENGYNFKSLGLVEE